MTNNILLTYIICVLSAFLFLVFIALLLKPDLFKDLNAFKVSFLAIIIVFLFYKLEFIFFVKTLSFYWMLPLVYGTSAVLISILNHQIISSDNSYYRLNKNKLIFLFLTTFIFASLFSVLMYYTNNYINDIIYLLDLNFGLTMIIGYNLPNNFSDMYNLKMDNVSNKSSSGTSTQPSGGVSNSNTPHETLGPLEHALDPLEHAKKIVELFDLKMESIEIKSRMRKLILDVNQIKSDNDLKVIEYADGSLGIDLPDEVDDKKTKYLSNKISVIDGVFSRYRDRIEGVFNECDTICSQIKGYNRVAAAHIESVEKHKSDYNKIVDGYKSLIDKE